MDSLSRVTIEFLQQLCLSESLDTLVPCFMQSLLQELEHIAAFVINLVGVEDAAVVMDVAETSGFSFRRLERKHLAEYYTQNGFPVWKYPVEHSCNHSQLDSSGYRNRSLFIVTHAKWRVFCYSASRQTGRAHRLNQPSNQGLYKIATSWVNGTSCGRQWSSVKIHQDLIPWKNYLIGHTWNALTTGSIISYRNLKSRPSWFQ